MRAEETYYKSEKFAEYLIVKGYSSRSQQTIRGVLKRFSVWSDTQQIELEQIRYTDILAYIDHNRKKGNIARTLVITVNAIKHYYNFLIDENELKENPCSNVQIKGVKRKILYETFTPEELETIYKTYCNTNTQAGGIGSTLAQKRNKIILGLIIYQGLKTEELARLVLSDVQIREGKITVHGSKRSDQRELKLEAHQLYDLMDYINETRKLLLVLTGKITDLLFLSLGTGDRFNNLMHKLLKQLQKQNSRIKSVQQLRTSVITNWLKTDNIRKVQYKAGHRYVSSTEGYQANDMDALKEDINKYHPDI